MPLFAAYIMVDWSGGDRRRANNKDCIWIAHGARTAEAPTTLSPPSRTEAESIIRGLLQPFASSVEDRVLVCADFAYGYPAGFSALLPDCRDDQRAPWLRVWNYLKQHLHDDLGTKPKRRPTNRSDRFDVANAINMAVSVPGRHLGPFWCLFAPGGRPGVPQNQPPQPFCHRSGLLEPLRITDRRAESDTPFRLFGTGSVGSQALTGIPRLESIRFDSSLRARSAVWPFETGWAPRDGTWLSANQTIVHAEIYPSVRDPLPDSIKDRGQVRAMWQWARDLDAQDLIVGEFALPAGIVAGSVEDALIRSEEGWILGCPRPTQIEGHERRTSTDM